MGNNSSSDSGRRLQDMEARNGSLRRELNERRIENAHLRSIIAACDADPSLSPERQYFVRPDPSIPRLLDDSTLPLRGQMVRSRDEFQGAPCEDAPCEGAPCDQGRVAKRARAWGLPWGKRSRDQAAGWLPWGRPTPPARDLAAQAETQGRRLAQQMRAHSGQRQQLMSRIRPIDRGPGPSSPVNAGGLDVAFSPAQLPPIEDDVNWDSLGRAVARPPPPQRVAFFQDL
jgi:hypothetical protein